MSLFKNIHRFLNRGSQSHGAALHIVQFCSMSRLPGQANFPRYPGGGLYHKDHVKNNMEISSNREATRWAGVAQYIKKEDS